jgi:hypothetical protein
MNKALRRSPLFRATAGLLLLAYTLLAEPRTLWALGRMAGCADAACTMASCPSKRGGVCCTLMRQQMEARYPGLRAALERLALADRAKDAGSCRLRQHACDDEQGSPIPAPGPLHLVPAGFPSLEASTASFSSSLPAFVRQPEPRELLKVPLVL